MAGQAGSDKSVSLSNNLNYSLKEVIRLGHKSDSETSVSIEIQKGDYD